MYPYKEKKKKMQENPLERPEKTELDINSLQKKLESNNLLTKLEEN
jgi:hypothetical protein